MKIKLLNDYAKLPTQGSGFSAGYDLYAAIPNETGPDGKEYVGCIEIPPHTTHLVSTGIAIQIPYDFWGGVYARSGLATKQGLRPANCVGVIDPDYRGEVMVALHNDTDEYRYVYCGDRIAQLVFHPRAWIDSWDEVEDLDETERGEGGFGSTGSK